MFSSRSGFDLTPNTLALKLAELIERRREVIDLTVSNPTALNIEYPNDEILRTLTSPLVLTYEPDPKGRRSAREAVRKIYLERQIDLDLDDILLTASTSEAYGYLFKLLADPGDRILVPAPSYPLFPFLAALESVEIVTYPLHFADDWICDLDELDRLASQCHPRSILVVHPNNPTGSFLREHELEFIRRICRREDAALVCDEVFVDFRLDEVEPTDPATDESVLTFILNGLSKMLLLPQLKLGWIVLRGPKSKRALARERLELIADTFLSVNSMSQAALGPLLEWKEPLQSRALDRLRRNLDELHTQLGGRDERLLPVGGGWSAVVRLPAIDSDEAFCLQLLEERGVLVHPGSFFGFASPGHFVVSLLSEPEQLARGIRSLLDWRRD